MTSITKALREVAEKQMNEYKDGEDITKALAADLKKNFNSAIKFFNKNAEKTFLKEMQALLKPAFTKDANAAIKEETNPIVLADILTSSIVAKLPADTNRSMESPQVEGTAVFATTVYPVTQYYVTFEIEQGRVKITGYM